MTTLTNGSRHPAHRRGVRLRRRLRQLPGVGPGRRHRRTARPGPGRRRVRATGSASGWAAGSPRWSTGSRSSSRRRGSSCRCRVRRDGGRRHPLRAPGDAGRASTTPPTSSSAASSASSSRSSAAPSRKLGRNAADGMQRTLRRRARPATEADASMKVAIVGAGVSGLTAAYALTRATRSACSTRSRRRAATSRRSRWRRRRAGRGRHGLHRLQRAHLPDVHPAARRARRRDPAERHVARVGLPGLRRRVQLARHRRLLRPADAPSLARASGG